MIMKKTIFYLSLAVLAVSCVKEQNPDVQAPEKTLAPMEFLACAEQTKTALAEDGMSVEWIEGDQVAVFDGSNINGEADEAQRFYARSSGPEALISGEADPAAEEYYAIYPFSSGHSLKNGVFTTQIKAQQIVESGSMAGNCAVVVGKAVAGSTKMEFKNVCSLVKFSLEKEGVKSLTLIGNNNEVIAGQFTLIWNNGDPQVTGNTKPEVTVTLRDAEGSDLAIGDYYFTILPTKFTKGFSVILGKNDGTQEIITRGAVPALSRNQIFRTQNNIPAAAYKAHESNFVKYNDGFLLTYAGVTVQKGTAEYAKYVNDGVAKISAEGVYFVGEESTAVSSSVIACSKHLIAGDNPSVRSKITMSKALQPKTADDGMIICADLDITSALTDFITQGQKFTTFDKIVLDNCKLGTIQRALCRFIDNVMILDSLVAEDCDFLLNNASETTSYMLNTNKMVSTINNIVYKNNVFQQVAENSVLTNFRFANCSNGTGATIKNVTVTNNTLVKAYLKQHGFVLAASLTGHCHIEDNFFVECHPAATELAIVKADSYADTMTYKITENFPYAEGATKSLKVADGTLPAKAGEGDTSRSSGRPRLLTANPLVDGWDPAKGVFGYKDGLQYYNNIGDAAGVNLPTGIGAQRTTSTAVLNRAGFNYTSEDLGTL